MAAIFGQFGDTQAGLTDNGFFNGFNLAATDEGEAGAGETVYRPTGDSFHSLVSLAARAGPAGELQSLTLIVLRSFVDGGQGAFARDIIKSFLGAVGGPQDRVLEPILTEIQFRDAPGPILMRGDPPSFSGPSSAAFRTMTGTGPAAAIDLARLRLALSNDMTGAPRFVIRAEPLAARRGGWLSRLLGR